MDPVGKILGDIRETDIWLANHCEDCGGKKTRKDADLCYKCAKKKAKTLGIKNLSYERYQYEDD